jgi:drug/metabolite transporter (DMT)-like permease
MLVSSLSSFYYLWNEAITLIGTQKTADLLFNPVFSGILAYFFLIKAIIMTQIVSMGIIITGLLLTNKSISFKCSTTVYSW